MAASEVNVKDVVVETPESCGLAVTTSLNLNPRAFSPAIRKAARSAPLSVRRPRACLPLRSLVRGNWSRMVLPSYSQVLRLTVLLFVLKGNSSLSSRLLTRLKVRLRLFCPMALSLSWIQSSPLSFWLRATLVMLFAPYRMNERMRVCTFLTASL